MIDDVILFLFLKTFHDKESAVFGEMCQSASCPNVNKLRGPSRHRHSDFEHRPFMSIKSFEQMQQVWKVTRYGVPLLANPF